MVECKKNSPFKISSNYMELLSHVLEVNNPLPHVVHKVYPIEWPTHDDTKEHKWCGVPPLITPFSFGKDWGLLYKVKGTHHVPCFYHGHWPLGRGGPWHPDGTTLTYCQILFFLFLRQKATCQHQSTGGSWPPGKFSVS